MDKKTRVAYWEDRVHKATKEVLQAELDLLEAKWNLKRTEVEDDL